MKVYQALAAAIGAARNCELSGNKDWLATWNERIDKICRENLPSGSGIDSGTTIDYDNSRPNRIVLLAPFHHMDENGYYDGWTDHKVIVTASLAFGFNIRIDGRNRNDIKEYLGDIYHNALNTEVSE